MFLPSSSNKTYLFFNSRGNTPKAPNPYLG